MCPCVCACVCVCVHVCARVRKQQALSACPNPMSTNPSVPWRPMWQSPAKLGRSMKLEAELRKTWLGD